MNIGSSEIISRLFRFFYKKRPNLPRYLVSWDVNVLLEFLMSWHPISSLSLERLTLKTVSLVAISSSDRGQTLEAMDIEHCHFSDEGILFPIYTLLKTSKINKPIKIVKCSKSTVESLDVCKYVSEYMVKTLKFRLKAISKGKAKPCQLFLSPFTGKPVKRATLAKYIVKTMRLAGIDVSQFTAHSVRGLLPSLMSKQGCSINQIMSQGDWSNVRTFNQYYNRHPDNSPAGILIKDVVGRSRN